MWLFLGILIGLIIIVVLVVIYYYNKIIVLSNRIDNAFSQIDVQLKRRNDLIPNLVSTVKGYTKHEKGVFEAVTKARSSIMNSKKMDTKMKASDQLTDALKSLFAVAESYPDLKANTNFLELQRELSGLESKIAYTRQFYNDTVLVYNNTVTMFPGLVFANILGKESKAYLETPKTQRETPKVDF